ncbi:unnamed protein product [Allacma fusca]|uniref:Epoxide hydrolase n=1 Tax=Allacma fusca TaxID=39272 RepID=A0A8J2P4L7_9HEXA|nr:unnamed protein product [Allacma fusca]
MGKITIIVIVIIAAFSYHVVQNILSYSDLTETLPEIYWGPKSSQNEKEDTSVKPFKINIDEKALSQLKTRLKEELASDRLTPPLEGIGFEYGFNSKYLKEVGTHWLTKYDWRSREKLLNQFPSFKTKISGLNIHFQHAKSSNNKKYKKTVPILVLHGWPSSFVDHQKLIPLLTDPKGSDVNFEVIVPSLPGYGFSDGASKPGMEPVHMGQIMVKLMKRLGHDKFYVQGGDWGGLIGATMTAVYPQNILGLHSIMCGSNHPKANMRLMASALLPSLFMTPAESERFPSYSKIFSFILRETGYFHIQATKPDTVGTGLSHSPLGLAAYLLEKYSTWTNGAGYSKADGGLTSKFTLDELLDQVTVYWFTNSITTSIRLYAESFGPQQTKMGLDRVAVKVPTACIVPKNDEWLMQTESMAAATFHNIISFKYANDGGHFFSLEHPDVLANDIIPFVNLLEKQ